MASLREGLVGSRFKRLLQEGARPICSQRFRDDAFDVAAAQDRAHRRSALGRRRP